MADYNGHARTNAVKMADKEGLNAFLSDWPIELYKNNCGKTSFYSYDDSGGWPSHGYDENDNEIEFSFEELMEYIEPGEVLVVMETGAEKLRYLVGYATAYVKTPTGEVKSCSVSIDDIYKKAAGEFDVEIKKIDIF